MAQKLPRLLQLSRILQILRGRPVHARLSSMPSVKIMLAPCAILFAIVRSANACMVVHLCTLNVVLLLGICSSSCSLHASQYT